MKYDDTNDNIEPALKRPPRTITVLLLLVGGAGTLSYLGSYAITTVLAASDLIPRWTPDHDPRPRWMLMSFAILLGGFALLGGVARLLAGRQLRRIEAMDKD